jgi:hypothetical protein
MDSRLSSYQSKNQVAERLGLSQRTIEDKGRLYEKTFMEKHSLPPNSPKNGLRRSYTSERKYLFDQRDLIEYEINAFQEKTGGELNNWRLGSESYGNLKTKGDKRNDR